MNADTCKIYPLSHGQRALWFLYQLAPESAAYNVAFTTRIYSDVDTLALRRVFQILMARHASLRTTFSTRGGEPIQEIHDYQEPFFEELDVSTWSWDELNKWVVDAHKRPFNLVQGPLLRVSLLNLSQQDHIFLLTLHHIACDEWSLWVLLDEFRLLYSAEKAGSAIFLPPISCQYIDYMQWQAEKLAGSAGEQLWEYWRKQLAGELPMLNLPLDQPRPPVQTYQGASYTFKLPEELAQRLYSLAQAEGVTPYMILLSAFQVLLHRYTGQEDILVGSPTTGRGEATFARTVGYLANPVVLRTQLSGNLTFKALLSQVRTTVLAAIAHQDYPFPLLVNRLQPNRDASRSPLFQVSFVLQSPPSKELASLLVSDTTESRIDWGGLELESFEMAQQEGQFDLTLEMVEARGTLSGALKYNTDLFDSATIVRMAGNLQTLLERIVANPFQRLSELSLLSEAEQHQLLVEWNDTQVEYPHNRCIHELFQAQTEQMPDAVAVVFEDQYLTYRELNHRANQLAHYLQALGVGPEVLVGICTERSLEIVVGLLAILKAGGAFIPLDPAYPQERLAFILSDSQVPVLLTQQKLVTVLPQHRARIICLDTDWEVLSQFGEKNPISGVVEDNLAYTIYTSGSTGKPKGVMIEHKGMLNHLYAKILDLRLTDADTVAQTASQSFDISVWQFFAALLVGGRVHIVKDEVTRDSAQLLEQVESQRISLLEIVPSLFQAMLEEIEFRGSAHHNLSKLRWLLLTGEALPPELCAQWLNYYPGIPLLNAYGPTECSDDVAHCPIYHSPEPGLLNMPIGRPVANMRLYVLDAQLQPVPIRVTGELYVGGIGVGRGYLNNSERTSEVFVPNPWAQTPGERLYKTGDQARYLPDGNIEFLGRLDHQVKIRGFRIELGEIEAVLAQHQDVRETVVVAWENRLGDKSIVAYIVSKQEQAPSISYLRRFLGERLPEYMLPVAFVMLEALPLTPNGKIDRRALPAPDSSKSCLEKDFVVPRDLLELQLAHIWADVLNVHSVGVKNNFFDLGGHSLLAVRLMTQIHQQFRQDLPIATLFQSPTIEQLSSILRQQTDLLPWTPLVAIQPGSSKRPLFCVHPADGTVLCYIELARHLGADQPFYGLQALGLSKEQKPHTRVEDMASQYIEALQAVQPQGPYLIAGWSFGGIVAFEMAQQLQARGQHVSLLALLDTYAPSVAPEKLQEQDDVALLVNLILGDISLSLNHLRRLRPDKQLIYVTEQAKQINLLPPDFGLEQARSLLQVYKSNCRAAQSYTPQPYTGRITLFRASKRTIVPPQDCTLGWGELATAGVEIYLVSGDHQTIVRKPQVQVLAEQLQAVLERV